MSCWDASCFGNRSYAREISNVEGLKLKLGHDRQTDHARPILCLISLWPIRKVRTTNEMESPANEWNGNAVASSPAHVWLRYPRQDPWSQDRRTVLISSGSCPWSRDLSFRFFNYSSWFFSLILQCIWTPRDVDFSRRSSRIARIPFALVLLIRRSTYAWHDPREIKSTLFVRN